MKVDFIIVGQGLAGTLLAFELHQLGKSFVVFDDPEQSKATNVAAGIINPVIFKRMNKSWLVDDAFPNMEMTYHLMENLLHEQFYFSSTIHRIVSEEESLFWKAKAVANQLAEYIDPTIDISYFNQMILASQGIGRVFKAGRIDLQKLTASFSKFLHQISSIRNEKFKYSEIDFKVDSVIYKDLMAQKLIFCEGASASKNPFFKNLKFKHSKGEILELSLPSFDLDEIISREIFIVPVRNNVYKVGATYAWDDLNIQPTDVAKEELLEKLKKITFLKHEIISHNAGIRPTMHDRKPVIGYLPDLPSVGIFNGFAAKGALLCPYFAKQFAENLAGYSTYINHEVDINRYFKHR